MDKLTVYIGYDDREAVAYHVLRHSIIRHAGNVKDLTIVPLKHRLLRKQGLFKRGWITDGDTGNRIDMVDGKPFSTEFSHSRWLVPHLNGYKGWALFLDCDMLFTDSVWRLSDYADESKGIVCYKHNHNPEARIKMDGQPQSGYFRKNWSSFMLINCEHPKNRILTPQWVNEADGGEMHSMCWLQDFQIGALPPQYNWIAGSSPANIEPSVIHYTEGGPWFDEDERSLHDGPFFELWEREYEHMLRYGDSVRAYYGHRMGQ